VLRDGAVNSHAAIWLRTQALVVAELATHQHAERE
jgi:hypothetical protein